MDRLSKKKLDNLLNKKECLSIGQSGVGKVLKVSSRAVVNASFGIVTLAPKLGPLGRKGAVGKQPKTLSPHPIADRWKPRFYSFRASLHTACTNSCDVTAIRGVCMCYTYGQQQCPSYIWPKTRVVLESSRSELSENIRIKGVNSIKFIRYTGPLFSAETAVLELCISAASVCVYVCVIIYVV